MRRRKNNMEDVFLRLAERLGVMQHGDHPDKTTHTAIYQARLDMQEYIAAFIHKDDLSPAAQKLRAQIRKM